MRIDYIIGSRWGATRVFWRDADDVDHAASLPGVWDISEASGYIEAMTQEAPPIVEAPRLRVV